MRTDMPALGAIFDNGQLVLSASYMRIKPRLAAGQGGEAELTTLGVILPRGRLTYRGSAVHRDTTGARDSSEPRTGIETRTASLGLLHQF